MNKEEARKILDTIIDCLYTNLTEERYQELKEAVEVLYEHAKKEEGGRMKIKDYKCRCGHDEFFFYTPENCIGENRVGIYCSFCGKWFKWANKDEKNLKNK